MASCGECKECRYWELSSDEVNGNCYHPNRPGRPLYGPTGHCLNFEQKGASMARCGECKWWEKMMDTMYCGHCQSERFPLSQQGGITSESGICDHFERKEAKIGTCKECRWWHALEDCHAYCGIQWVDAKGVMNPNEEGDTCHLGTNGNFGCVHFEQKPKGPFTVENRVGDYGITFDRDWLCLERIRVDDLKRLCEWFNAHWIWR